VKLRQPRAGYAYVDIYLAATAYTWDPRGHNNWDPRNVGNINPYHLDRDFRIFASLEEMIEEISGGKTSRRLSLGPSVEHVTKYVTQALKFVATAQPPERPPEPPEWEWAPTYD
jgi:hypothetical protein